MLSSAVVESKEIKSTPIVKYTRSLSAFVKANKANPAATVETLLAAFSSPDSRVAFALDELNGKERETFLDGLPVPLQIYFGKLHRWHGLRCGDKAKHSEEWAKEILERFKDSPPELIHAMKVRMAIFNNNATLFWALIKQSKGHVNLADLIFVDNHPPAHSREYDLSGLNLKRFRLAGGASLKLNLAGSDLSEAMLSCHSLDGSDFRGANLHLAEISGSCSYANFKDVDLSKTRRFWIHGSVQGADFRGAILTNEIKGKLRTYFHGTDSESASYKPIDRYLYEKTRHLIWADFKKVKFDFDFDCYVYAMLLSGAKSKKEFAEIMKLVPEELKIKKYWFFGTRTKVHSFWKAIEDVFKSMPDIVAKPATESFKLEQAEENISHYVPSRLEEYCRDYHRKPVPGYIASIIIKVIKDTRFVDPSYKLIEHADENHFVPAITLKGIDLKDETLDGIISQLKSYASISQGHPSPKKIIQSIEALKAEFFFKQFKATRSMPEVAESKEPISSSTTSVLSGLSGSATVDSALNKHPLFEEIFTMLDSEFKKQLEPHRKMMVYGLARKDQAGLDEVTIQCRKACARELMKIWEHKNLGCLSVSSIDIGMQSQRFKDVATSLGYEISAKKTTFKIDDNGFFDALDNQLKYFPELKAASETPEPDNIFGIGFAYAKVEQQLSQLMDINILAKVMANYLGKLSISKDIYYNGAWLDDLIIIALSRGIGANITLLKNDGSVVQHIENATFPMCCFGFDGDNYYSLRFNPELKPTKSLPEPSDVHAVPSLSELKESFFSWSIAALSSTTVPSLSSVPAKKQ